MGLLNPDAASYDPAVFTSLELPANTIHIHSEPFGCRLYPLQDVTVSHYVSRGLGN